jgi:hypothetical protein
MAPLGSSHATLCIYGDDLDPERITRLLGSPPSRSHRRGDEVSSRLPGRAEGAWFLEDELPEGGTLADKIVNILQRVIDDTSIWAEFGRRYRVRMSCGLFIEHENEGFAIPSDVLDQLSKRGIRLDFDIYVLAPSELDPKT